VVCNYFSPTAAQFSGMVLPAAERTSPEEFNAVLARLEYLLANLPEQLPSSDSFFSRYGAFLSFALDPDILEKTGDEIATLGEQLEGIFGWNARTSGDGIIPILERGKAICALHPILKGYHEKFPDNNVLKKWVLDVIAGTEKAFTTCGVAVRLSNSSSWCKNFTNLNQIPTFQCPPKGTGTKRSQSGALLGLQKGDGSVASVLICPIEQISITAIEAAELETFWTWA
jgi:hypothetical protein